MWNRKLKKANNSSRGSSCARKMEDADLISQLPDHLLLHIFSFLDETAVFQSSILSRRWHHLWTLVPFPVHIIRMRSYFNDQKEAICKWKLVQEEEATNTISKLPITVAKYIAHSFVIGLSFTTAEFKEFVLIHPLFTLLFMRFMYLVFSSKYSRLCDTERYLKRLQMRDARLTSNANSYSTTKIPMELLFPENYEPRYAKSAKVYCLIGILLLVIISCSTILLKLKFDFRNRIGVWNLWIAILSALGNVVFGVYHLLKK